MTVTLCGLPPEITANHKFVIVDTELAAQRAAVLLPTQCVLWPSEMMSLDAIALEAWLPLQGNDVLLWPTNLDAACDAMVRVGVALKRVTDSVRIVALHADDPHGFSAAAMQDFTKAQLIEWAKARVKAFEPPATPPPAMLLITDVLPPIEEDWPPESSKVTRGKPRTQRDGSPSKGRAVGPEGFISWEELGLEKPDNGAPYPHIANVQRILEQHPAIVGRLWYDEFHDRVFSTLFGENGAVHEWSDHHDTRLTAWIQTNLRMAKMGVQTVQRALDDFARLHVRNEPKEWMLDLKWDATERLPTLMADGWGTEQNDYTAAVGRCWMVSMVARILNPGCQVDYMPVFEGVQGLRKSTAIATLGGKWFAEAHANITTKDFFQDLQGKMLLEVSELHAFRRDEVEKVKQVVSCRNDRYRESYGRRSIDHPRRCVFAGTTNRDDWVADDTGARRFWPIACGEINTDYIASNRDQLFAEAVHRWKNGEKWWDVDVDMASAEQDARRELDLWTETVLTWAAQREYVTVPDVLSIALGIPIERQGKVEQMRVGTVLRVAKWDKRRRRRGGRNTQHWFNPKYPVGTGVNENVQEAMF